MNAKKQGFSADQRGAIMILSLFMAFSLIGALWYILGIGQALIYRDRMQAVADSSAFASAVVQARFMNMIAAINLVMLALVAVHLLLAIVHALTVIALAAAIIAFGISCIGALIGYPACFAAGIKPFQIAQKIAKIALDVYDTGLDYALLGLSFAEWGLAKTGPFVGAVVGEFAARKHNDEKGKPINAIVLSTDMEPSGDKLGLPVKEEKAQILCKYLVSYIPFVGSGPVQGAVMDLFCDKTYISKTFPSPLPFFYGKGLGGHDWWVKKDHGPKGNWDKPGSTSSEAKNGSDWYMVYGGLIAPAYVEQSEHLVGFGKQKLGSSFNDPNSKPTIITYFASAEFYFDCNSTWDAAKCDGGGHDNALYSIGWKARLVRTHIPKKGIGKIFSVFQPVLKLVNWH